jgi:hypothetical protein
VTLEAAIVYVFTYSSIAERLLKFFAPRSLPLFTEENNDRLLIVVKLNQLQQAPTSVNSSSASYGIASANMAPPMATFVPKKEFM